MSWAEVKMAVKSIQRGYATVANSDVTITLPKAIDPTRCLVLLDGNAGMYLTSATSSVTRYCRSLSPNDDTGVFIADANNGGWSELSSFTIPYAYGYGAARKPYVKALTETQLTIGQSGTYSNGSNGTTVSYQVIEFFN